MPLDHNRAAGGVNRRAARREPGVLRLFLGVAKLKPRPAPVAVIQPGLTHRNGLPNL